VILLSSIINIIKTPNRLNRLSYLWRYAFWFITLFIPITVTMIKKVFFPNFPLISKELNILLSVCTVCFYIGATFALIRCCVARLHDLNMSGWWIILFPIIKIIPIFGFTLGILLFIWPGTNEPNKFGEPIL